MPEAGVHTVTATGRGTRLRATEHETRSRDGERAESPTLPWKMPAGRRRSQLSAAAGA